MIEENSMTEEKNTFIVRCGEVALKGLNKPYFERMLVDRIKRVLKKYNGVEVKRHEGLIFVRALKELDSDAIVGDISRVSAWLPSVLPSRRLPTWTRSAGRQWIYAGPD